MLLGASLLAALLLRWGVALYPHSGEGRPPMYGDYEAQRHWQEITLHLPAARWYRNGTHNDLRYWGLDYPPLSAYHSLALAHAAGVVEPDSVALFASRGHSSPRHKLFMRWTVFAADLYCFLPAVACFFRAARRAKVREMRALRLPPAADRNAFSRPDLAACFAMLYPGLVLVDYGHFQYNCASLGLFAWAAAFVALDKLEAAALFFSLALNYKQMELYHAPPFFVYMLRRCFPPAPSGLPLCARLRRGLVPLARIAAVVLLVFLLAWLPFLGDRESALAVLARLFPLERGVFEDKVANAWCALNVFVKLKAALDDVAMAKVCLAATALALLPSCLDLFLRPSGNKFALALINSSLSFFLFSFQAHEKSVLLCAVPVLLRLPLDPVPCVWFLTVSTFSMLPLLIKDGLLACYVSLSVIYLAAFGVAVSWSYPRVSFWAAFDVTAANNALKGTEGEYGGRFYAAFNLVSAASLLTMVALVVCSAVVPPPARYPDLFPLLVSVFSFCLFFLFYLYFNYCQLTVPSEHYVLCEKRARR